MILVTLATEIRNLTFICFFFARVLLKQGQAQLKYHISNLMMKIDLQTKKKCIDFFYNVQKLIPNISQVSSSVLRFG